MFFLFDFANYFKMIRLAWNEKVPRARYRYLAVLLIGVAVRQSTSPTARVEQQRGVAPACTAWLAPATGAFNAAMAVSIADWKRE